MLTDLKFSLNVSGVNQRLNLSLFYETCELNVLSNSECDAFKFLSSTQGQISYDLLRMECTLNWLADSLVVIFMQDPLENLKKWLWNECFDKQYLMFFKEKRIQSPTDSLPKPQLLFGLAISDLEFNLAHAQLRETFCIRMSAVGTPISDFDIETSTLRNLIGCRSCEGFIKDPANFRKFITLCNASMPVKFLEISRTSQGWLQKVDYSNLVFYLI